MGVGERRHERVGRQLFLFFPFFLPSVSGVVAHGGLMAVAFVVFRRHGAKKKAGWIDARGGKGKASWNGVGDGRGFLVWARMFGLWTVGRGSWGDGWRGVGGGRWLSAFRI